MGTSFLAGWYYNMQNGMLGMTSTSYSTQLWQGNWRGGGRGRVHYWSVLISKLISNCNVKKKSKRIILHGWTLLFPEDMVIEWKQKCNAWDRFPWGNGHWGYRGQQRLLSLPLITCHQNTVRHFKRHCMLGLQDAEKSIIANRPGNYSLFSTGLLSKCL